jgi:hypothetical protein
MGGYTPIRTPTLSVSNNYSARPLPWWNRTPIHGTPTQPSPIPRKEATPHAPQ